MRERSRDLKRGEKDLLARWRGLDGKKGKRGRVAARGRGRNRKSQGETRGNPRVWRLGGLGPVGLLSL